MADVRLNIADVRRRGLPAVCAACGEPATEFRRRWFTWTPGRNIPFALLGTWRYHRVTLEVPFCSADRGYFTRRWAPLLIAGLLVIAAGTASYVIADITRGAAHARAMGKWLTPTVAGVVAILYLIGKAVKRRSIRIVDVDGKRFTLASVSDKFAAAARAAPADDEPPFVTAVDDPPHRDRSRRT